MFRAKKILGVFMVLVLSLTAVGCGEVRYYNENEVPALTSFGSYAQTLVTDSVLIGELKNERTSNGVFEYKGVAYEAFNVLSDVSATFTNGEQIVSGLYFFYVEDIEWIVLNDADDLYLSKNVLDARRFTEGERNSVKDEDSGRTYYSNDWCFSELREWLNGEFLNKSLSKLEQEQIKVSINKNNQDTVYPSYSNEAYNIPNSEDKFFVPSYEEITDSANGFSSVATDYDCLRMTYVTDYARAKGAFVYQNLVTGGEKADKSVLKDSGNYWLRSVGSNGIYASIVRYTGATGAQSYNVNTADVGVRPAVRLLV